MNIQDKGLFGGDYSLAIRIAVVIALFLTIWGIGSDTLEGIGIFFMVPPCEARNGIADALGILMPIFLVLSIFLQIWVVKRPSFSLLLVATFAPAAFWTAHKISNDWDTKRQVECRARPLEVAMKVCRANPNWYVVGKGVTGSQTLTLMAPGQTDAAWTCLYWWATWSDSSVTVIVDESVYQAARKRVEK